MKALGCYAAWEQLWPFFDRILKLLPGENQSIYQLVLVKLSHESCKSVVIALALS